MALKRHRSGGCIAANGKRSAVESEKPPALELATNRIAVREYSAAEMEKYLKAKGYDELEAEQAVASLVERGLIDDRRFARVVARHQAMRERGPMAVLQKLKQKGVRADLRQARELFQETSDQDEHALITRFLERRFPGLAGSRDRKLVQRAYGALLRRGFSPESISAALRKLKTPELD